MFLTASATSTVLPKPAMPCTSTQPSVSLSLTSDQLTADALGHVLALHVHSVARGNVTTLQHLVHCGGGWGGGGGGGALKFESTY